MQKGLPGKTEHVAPDKEVRPAEFTEGALTLDFVERHADDLRYVAAWGKWFCWRGTHWEEEDTLHAFDLARKLCNEQSVRANKPAIAKTLASAKTRAAVASMARETRRIAATIGQWDTDPWLLNTPGGVVDLRTGQLRAHRREDYMTKITTVAPDSDCPLWLNFLDTITAGDKKLQAYLQRALGYALTGLVDEHALFFFYGTGSNGKSTLLNTVASILGDYYQSASIETFTITKGDKHPADLAALRGARLVVTSETEVGQHWAESRINRLTGGDPIQARFMRQDFFTYIPQFKLFFMGNHKPALRTVNVAIRRRFNLVPFGVVISAKERDKKLPTRLKQEGPGILQWMIEGCLAWQQDGLAPPDSVTNSTEEYLTAEDVIGAWIEDCCERDAGAHTSTRELYASWNTWAQATGAYSGGEKWLASKLDDAGFKYERLRHGEDKIRGYWGLRVRRGTESSAELPF